MTRNRLLLPLLLVFALVVSAPVPAPAQESEFDKRVDDFVGDHVELRSLLAKLQSAVAAHDVNTVAAMVNYPIKVSPNRRPTMVRTPTAFIAQYDRIMKPGIVQAIEKQKYEDLFVRDQGAMVGNGEVWFARRCRDQACSHSVIKINSIQNVAGMAK